MDVRMLARRPGFISGTHWRGNLSRWSNTTLNIPSRSCSFVAFGMKKKKKKSVDTGNQPMESEPDVSMKDYLEFGSMLGFSVDETMTHIQGKYGGAELDGEAQEIRDKIADQERKEQRLVDMTDSIMDGKAAWEGAPDGEDTPMWAKDSKYANAWKDMDFSVESEDADANVLGGSSFDYLEGLGEIPEDFTYDDFEKMLAKIPENLMDGSFEPPAYSREPEWDVPGLSDDLSLGAEETTPEVPETPPLANKPSASFQSMEDMEERLKDQLEYLGEIPVPGRAPKKAITSEVPDLPIPSLEQRPGWKSEEQEEEKQTQIASAKKKASSPIEASAAPIPRGPPKMSKANRDKKRSARVPSPKKSRKPKPTPKLQRPPSPKKKNI